MALNFQEVLTVTANANTANTAGTANSFSRPGARTVGKIRYWIVGSANASNSNHALQVSPDGTIWANVAAETANIGATVVTGTFVGDVRSVRLYNGTGDTWGDAATTAKVAGILRPASGKDW